MNQLNIRSAEDKDLNALAICHMKAFPRSLSTAMGKSYTRKTLEWYLVEKDAVMLIAEDSNGKALGYAGGLLVHGQTRTGSTTAMGQHAFKIGILAILFRPWLIFHPQIRRHFPYIRYFLKRQWKRLFAQSKAQEVKKPKLVRRSMGLVGIGILPDMQGKGVGSALLQAFEKRARELGAEFMDLSVEPDNEKAIRSYKRNGWEQIDGVAEHCVMHKELEVNE